MRSQRGEQRVEAGPSLARRALEPSLHDRRDRRTDPGGDRRERREGARADGKHELDERNFSAPPHLAPAQPLVQRRAETPDVRALVDAAGIGRVLGRHVHRRPEDAPRARQLVRAVARGLLERLGETEVAELHRHRAVGRRSEEDVRRLDVPVDDPARMGGAQPGRRLREDAEQREGLDRAALLEERAEVATLEQLHDEERHTERHVGAELDRAGYVGVVDLGHRVRLADEARDDPGIFARSVARDHLRREALPGRALLLFDLVDGPHAAASERAQDAVAPPEPVPEQRIVVGARDPFEARRRERPRGGGLRLHAPDRGIEGLELVAPDGVGAAAELQESRAQRLRRREAARGIAADGLLDDASDRGGYPGRAALDRVDLAGCERLEERLRRVGVGVGRRPGDEGVEERPQTEHVRLAMNVSRRLVGARHRLRRGVAQVLPGA